MDDPREVWARWREAHPDLPDEAIHRTVFALMRARSPIDHDPDGRRLVPADLTALDEVVERGRFALFLLLDASDQVAIQFFDAIQIALEYPSESWFRELHWVVLANSYFDPFSDVLKALGVQDWFARRLIRLVDDREGGPGQSFAAAIGLGLLVALNPRLSMRCRPGLLRAAEAYQQEWLRDLADGIAVPNLIAHARDSIRLATGLSAQAPAREIVPAIVDATRPPLVNQLLAGKYSMYAIPVLVGLEYEVKPRTLQWICDSILEPTLGNTANPQNGLVRSAMAWLVREGLLASKVGGGGGYSLQKANWASTCKHPAMRVYLDSSDSESP